MKRGHLPNSIAFFQLSSFKFSLYVLLLLFQGNNQLLCSVSSRETHSEPIFLEGITWAQPPWRKVWRFLKNQKQNYPAIPFLGIYLEKTINLKRYLHPNVHFSTLYNSPDIQFSCSVVSDSLRPYELQHARPPCPSPSPRVHSDSCPSSW